MEKVREALDRRAEEWIAILDSHDIDAETLEPAYTDEQKDRIAERLKNWLKERKRLFPEEKPQEGNAVASMREWMQDPKARGELEAMLRKIVGQQSAEKVGKKTRDRTAELTKDAEGSALHKLVFEPEETDE